MSNKKNCLALDGELFCKKFGAGMFNYFQIFKGQYFFAEPANTEQDAWKLAYAVLINQFQVGQSVVYVDELMPDTVEKIESIIDGWVSFNNGSRGCIQVMIRPATKDEIQINKRLFVNMES